MNIFQTLQNFAFRTYIPDPSTGRAAGGSYLGVKLYGAEGALLGGIAGSVAGYFGLGEAIEVYKTLWNKAKLQLQ